MYFFVLQEGNRLVQEEYLGRVYTAILAHPTLQELAPTVPQLLVNHAKGVLLMHRLILILSLVRLFILVSECMTFPVVFL